MEKATLINGFKLNLDYAKELVVDIKEIDMVAQPQGFANHPAFTLGHLISAICLCIELLGRPYDIPDDWDDLFRRKGPGDPRRPTNQIENYPTKQALISVLNKKANQLIELIHQMDEEQWSEKHNWKLTNYMETTGQVLFFHCFIHFAWHIGQLAEWRRMMNYDSALARLVISD